MYDFKTETPITDKQKIIL